MFFIVLVADQVIKRLVGLPLAAMVDALHAFERKRPSALGQWVGIVLETLEHAFVKIQIQLLARDVVGTQRGPIGPVATSKSAIKVLVIIVVGGAGIDTDMPPLRHVAVHI